MLTPRDRERLAQLEAFQNKIHHARGIVERFATQPRDSDALAINVRRTVTQLKLVFTTGGFDQLAQICVNLESAARMGSNHQARASKLREGIGTLSRLVEQERRAIQTAARSGGAGAQ
jgi:hypothetical protein